jgi:hypothetical protein
MSDRPERDPVLDRFPTITDRIPAEPPPRAGDQRPRREPPGPEPGARPIDEPPPPDPASDAPIGDPGPTG